MPSLPPIHRWDSISQPRASVHILHGMAEHGRRYARLAGDLNRAGFVVWAHDHRGHGTNATPPVGLGHFGDTDGWRALVGDAWAVSEHAGDVPRATARPLRAFDGIVSRAD